MYALRVCVRAVEASTMAAGEKKSIAGTPYCLYQCGCITKKAGEKDENPYEGESD